VCVIQQQSAASARHCVGKGKKITHRREIGEIDREGRGWRRQCVWGKWVRAFERGVCDVWLGGKEGIWMRGRKRRNKAARRRGGGGKGVRRCVERDKVKDSSSWSVFVLFF
jgi:hypothetical protein